MCGQLPAVTVALDGLAAGVVRLDVLEQVPDDAAAVLREQGVLDRNRVDTLENLVGIVETLGREVFHAAVPEPTASQLLKAKGMTGNVFQRLDSMADLFVLAGFGGLRRQLGSARWARLLETRATRHAFTHRDGTVDAKFLADISSSTLKSGSA